MNNKGKSYQDIRAMLGKVRKATPIMESKDDNSGGIPYTDQDELYKYAIESTRQNFGADYSKSKTPMLYFPDDGDVTLSGKVPSLNNASFHYRYTEKDGCYLWINNLSLTDDVLETIRLILGTYKNWRKEIENYGDRVPIGYRAQEQ